METDKGKRETYHKLIDSMTHEEREEYYFRLFRAGSDTWEEYSDVVLYNVDKEKHVATITFNRPEFQNAIPHAAYPRVAHLISEAEYDDNVKMLVFKSIGEDFGTGADAGGLAYMIGFGDGKTPEGRERPSQHRRMWFDRDMFAGPKGMVGRLSHFTKVSIMAVHGYCYGVHLMLAMAADLVIATEDTLFTHPAWRYLGPVFNHYDMIECVGRRVAMELYFTGGPFDAQRAYQVGMVNRVVPKDKLDKEVDDWCAAIRSRSLDSIVMSKVLMQMVGESRGMTTGAMSEWMGHPWLTNQKLRPDEFNFAKARRDKGVTGAFDDADAMLPDRFKISKRRRAAAGLYPFPIGETPKK